MPDRYTWDITADRARILRHPVVDLMKAVAGAPAVARTRRVAGRVAGEPVAQQQQQQQQHPSHPHRGKNNNRKYWRRQTNDQGICPIFLAFLTKKKIFTMFPLLSLLHSHPWTSIRSYLLPSPESSFLKGPSHSKNENLYNIIIFFSSRSKKINALILVSSHSFQIHEIAVYPYM